MLVEELAVNIVKRIVKEVLLVPKHIASGAWEAIDETVNGSPKKEPKK